MKYDGIFDRTGVFPMFFRLWIRSDPPVGLNLLDSISGLAYVFMKSRKVGLNLKCDYSFSYTNELHFFNLISVKNSLRHSWNIITSVGVMNSFLNDLMRDLETSSFQYIIGFLSI